MGVSTTWTGASSSAWNTAGNWTNGVPVATGTAIIDGAVDITGGAPANNEVDRFYVASTYTGALGSTGTPLEIDSAEVSIDNGTSGSTHYLHLEGANNATPAVVVDGLKTGNALYLSGDIDRLLVKTSFLGTLHLGNSASKQAVPNDVVVNTSSGIVDATVAANVAWVTAAEVHVTNGTLKLGENIGQDSTLTISGGVVQVDDWTVTTGDTFLIHGGTVKWLAGSTGLTPSSVNTVRVVEVFGNGTFTLDTNEKAYVGFENIVQWGGTVNLAADFPNVDINTDFTYYAGSYTPPQQSAITAVGK